MELSTHDTPMTSEEEETGHHSAPAPMAKNLKSATTNAMLTEEQEEQKLLQYHISLLGTPTGLHEDQDIAGTPLFTMPVKLHYPRLFTQYGFFAGLSHILDVNLRTEPVTLSDPRLFFNIAAPSSGFICGSQGSGKSHSLSCLLESCLMRSGLSKLEHPLAALVFHYDTFTSDICGTPCEAAYLSSNSAIKVRILCSPTNVATIKRTYAGHNVQIEPLLINQSNLNTQRMMDLMAVKTEDGSMPLYLHAITRILKDMRMVQQQTNSTFNYAEFKKLVSASPMSPAQLQPLQQRLDTLESFMPKGQTQLPQPGQAQAKKTTNGGGNDWTIRPGTLTIVDLSCPCVTAEAACSLFNMCLSLYLEQKTTVGRVIGLDEAHKYMNSTTEASALTSTLLTSIRLQRHLGTRVFISTQEPTISPALLDLCSFTIVHRFTSPAWLQALKSHLAALSHEDLVDSDPDKKLKLQAVFKDIVNLRVGEALLFSPSATTGVKEAEGDGEGMMEMVRLGTGYLKVKIRARITSDGGKSFMAT